MKSLRWRKQKIIREARDMNYTNLQGIYGIYTKESELLYYFSIDKNYRS